MFSVLLAPGFAADGSGEALRFLARYYRDRNERLLAILRAAIGPLTTLLLGSAVLLLTLGIFRSVSTLINAVDPMRWVTP
jgi:type II secretory pathway component PulF